MGCSASVHAHQGLQAHERLAIQDQEHGGANLETLKLTNREQMREIEQLKSRVRELEESNTKIADLEKQITELKSEGNQRSQDNTQEGSVLFDIFPLGTFPPQPEAPSVDFLFIATGQEGRDVASEIASSLATHSKNNIDYTAIRLTFSDPSSFEFSMEALDQQTKYVPSKDELANVLEQMVTTINPRVVVAVLSKHSVTFPGFVYSLRVASAYQFNSTLVHDFSSGPFPPYYQQPTDLRSGIFESKAILYHPDYIACVCYDIINLLDPEEAVRVGPSAFFDDDYGLEEGHFHTFLSHRRSTGQGIAGRIFQSLKDNQISAFLDSEAKFKLHNLEEIVSNCQTFIFIITDTIWDSEFCLAELKAAVANNLPIIWVKSMTVQPPKHLPELLTAASITPKPTEYPFGVLPSTEPVDFEKLIQQQFKTALVYVPEYFDRFMEKIRSRIFVDWQDFKSVFPGLVEMLIKNEPIPYDAWAAQSPPGHSFMITSALLWRYAHFPEREKDDQTHQTEC